MKALIDVTEDLEIVRDILDQQVMDRDENEIKGRSTACSSRSARERRRGSTRSRWVA